MHIFLWLPPFYPLDLASGYHGFFPHCEKWKPNSKEQSCVLIICREGGLGCPQFSGGLHRGCWSTWTSKMELCTSRGPKKRYLKGDSWEKGTAEGGLILKAESK